jgi:nicotinate-nucleotide adenylyltransferase
VSHPGGATGILGGTFDPVHLGHVEVARQVREDLGLARVLLVPSSSPPHREAPSASPEDRLEMARLAIAGHPGLEVDDVEVRRGGTSYAVDTLHQLKQVDPGRELVLLLGRDAAVEFGSWHRAAEIGDLARVAVFNRAGSDGGPIDVEAAGLPAATILLEVDSPAISATEIRDLLALGGDVSGMVPASVLEYIRDHALYRSRVGGPRDALS